MSLYLKYRPTSFEEMYGNEEMILALTKMIENKKSCPHSFLMTGTTGSGKTTTARIIASMLGCSGSDLREIDTADFRGIDTIREIRKNSQFASIESECRVWIIDECFAKNTLINTPIGDIPIQDIKKGDYVYSLAGKDLVKSVFKNKIPIGNLIKLTFTNKKIIYCSKDHLFLTKNKWKKACKLNKNDLILPFDREFMIGIDLQKKGNKNETYKMVLRKLRGSNFQKTTKILFKNMLKYISWEKKNCSDRISELYSLRKINSISSQSTGKTQHRNLWAYLWKYSSRKSTNRYETIRKIKAKIFQISKNIFANRTGKNRDTTKFGKNENKKSSFSANKYRQSPRNQTNPRFVACVERDARGKWYFDRFTNSTINGIGMADGSSDPNQTFPKRWFRIPNLLQSRYRQSKTTISNRSRWKWAQIEAKYVERSEKNQEIEPIRLESAEIYQRGSNEQSFKSVITDTERDQEFIILYDLEIENHPSYFTEGITVHNCHKLTGDAQSALLKILEDTPSHVYFILCTTDPQQLLATIKGRCSTFQVKPLDDDQMRRLLKKVVKAEQSKLDAEIYDQIIADSEGQSRDALQSLEIVLQVPPENRMEIAKRSKQQRSRAFELCKALLGRKPWKEVAAILVTIKEEPPESIRRMVLGYAQAVLLNGANNKQAGYILECFSDPTYNIGFPGITLACYSSLR